MRRGLVVFLLAAGISFAEDEEDSPEQEHQFSFFQNLTYQIQGDALTSYQHTLLESQPNLLFIGKTGMLEGLGTIAPEPGYYTIINNNGILTPGLIDANGDFIPGSINVKATGDDPHSTVVYKQGSEGELHILFNNPDSFSQLNLDGGGGSAKALLDGTLEVKGNTHFDVVPGQQVEIIRASSGVEGTFAHIQGFDLPSLVPVLTYYSDHVTLSFSPTLNQYPGGIAETTFTAVNRNNIFLSKQTAALRSGFSGGNKAVAWMDLECRADAPGKKETITPPPSKKEKPVRLYIGPTGSMGSVDTKSRQVGFDYWSVGALAGFDYSFSQAAIGALLNYDGIEAHIDNGWGKTETRQLLATLYATYAFERVPALSMDFLAAGGYDWNTIRRNAGTPVNKKVASGSADGSIFDALFGVQYTFSNQEHSWMPQNFRWTPLASLQFINLNMDSYHETGAGGFDLAVDSEHAQSLRSTLQMLLNYKKRFSTWTLGAGFDAGWQWEFLDKDRSIGFAPLNVPGPSGSIGTVGAGGSTLLLGADLTFGFKEERIGLILNYDFEWNSLFYDNYFSVAFSLKW